MHDTAQEIDRFKQSVIVGAQTEACHELNRDLFPAPPDVTWTPVARFFVSGIPKPGGSKRGFYIAKLKRVVITDDCKRNASWKDTVATFARQAYGGDPIRCPMRVEMSFVMPRLKGHYGSGKNAGVLKTNAPDLHTVKPDTTKLVRSTEDALTGILWIDDAIISDQMAQKRYGDRPGVLIAVSIRT